MLVAVLSFGYKYGVPPEADLVFDARFLPNPNFVPALQRLTGADHAVVALLRRKPETARLPEAAAVASSASCCRATSARAELPDAGGRLHGRPPPLGDAGERARRRRQAQGLPGARRAPRREAGVRPMIGIVVVTHGQLAEELVNAARTILGEHPGIVAVSHRLGRRRRWPRRARSERAIAEVGGRRHARAHRHVRRHPDQPEPAVPLAAGRDRDRA